MYVYICTYIHTGLEICGFPLPHANYFWGKSESHWLTNSQYFLFTANQFRPIANHFCLWILKKTLFRVVLCNKEQQCKKLRITANQFK